MGYVTVAWQLTVGDSRVAVSTRIPVDIYDSVESDKVHDLIAHYITKELDDSSWVIVETRRDDD